MRLFMKPEISDWSMFDFKGRGLNGDYWFPIVIVLYALFMFFLEGRGKLRSLFHVSLIVWHLGLTLAVTFGSMQQNADITFGAWGVSLSLKWLIAPLALFTVLAIMYVIAERRKRIKIVVSAWNQVNWKTLVLILGLFPISYFLFHFGHGFNFLVKLAIVINIIQWILLSEALGRQESEPQ